MTATLLRAKRDEVLARCDVVRSSYGARSMEFAEAQRTLTLLDQEIAKADASETGIARNRRILCWSPGHKGL